MMISTYIKCLISTMVICSLVLFIAPESDGSLKRYLKYICGLVMLITLVCPILNGCDNTELEDRFPSFFQSQNLQITDQYKDMEKSFIHGTVSETAYAVMTYLHTEYGIPGDDISVTVITDEGTEPHIDEIHLYIYNCNALDREKIRSEIEKMAGIKVYVFVKNKR